MGLLTIILIIITIYLTLTAILPALIVPNLWLYHTKPKITSKKLKQTIKKLNKNKDDEKFVKAAFLFITKRYHPSGPITFLFHLPKLFWHNPNKIIEKPGFSYCFIDFWVRRPNPDRDRKRRRNHRRDHRRGRNGPARRRVSDRLDGGSGRDRGAGRRRR